ncbi:MAG TPA: DUF4129 domain-containing protein [Gaiellaceae bacterium]|nr:DUF4129 domain-containing protein [Gaiellaceae bacterium]
MRNGVSRRLVLVAAALLGLTAVVALASRAKSPTGGGATDPASSDTLVEYVLLFGAVALVVTFCVAVYLLVTAHRNEGFAPPPRSSLWRTLIFVFVSGAAAVLLASRLHHFQVKEQPQQAPVQATSPDGKNGPRGDAVPFDWVPVAVVGGLTALGLATAAMLLLRHRAPKKRLPRPPAEALALALDASLDDLLAEPDPRRAVIAAYARMEGALAASGLARKQAEAPREYLERTLPELGASAGSARRLTTLFERAKFSPHRIDAAMKDEAIAALTALRDELRGTVAQAA